MSGIAGIVNLDGAPLDAQVLARVTQRLAFRGPDALMTWSAGAVGFGHALLRTGAEPARERQPTSLDRQTWITADVRLDAREELAGKLAAKGRQGLNQASDAEVILHAYQVWGEQCLEHLLGDFAFAIWDGLLRRLWCARDPLGLKPFFYAQVGQSLVFSNTLNAVRAYPGVSAELNERAIADFLLLGWNPEPASTCFADIQRLPAAHALSCTPEGLRVSRYWSPPVDGVLRYRRPEDYLERFLELLRAAVADRLRSNRAAVLMSGGLDSTAVAAVAQQALQSRGEPGGLRAYTVDYRPLLADEEARYARMVAEALCIPIQFLDGTSRAPYEHWRDPESCGPEPSHEPLAALQSDQLRLVAEHSRVALSGDGGDVLLHGQSGPYLAWLARQGQFIRLFREVGRYALSHGRFPPLLAGYRARLGRLLGRSDSPSQYPGWLNTNLESRLGLRARWEELNRLDKPAHAVRPAAYAALTASFWPDTFESEDPGVTGIPVEVRAPLFDLRLVRYLLALPPLPWCVDKKLLRVAMEGILPEPVRRRPKSPLASDPLAELLKRQGWRPEAHFAPVPELARYVDPQRVPPVTGRETTESIWLNLRPVSLNYWLRSEARMKDQHASENVHEAPVTTICEEALPESEIGRVRQSG